MTPEFLITSFVVVVAPGTGVLYTLAVGVSRGVWAGAAAAFGCTLGILPHLTASILGLAALLHTSAVAFQVMKFAGMAYLLFMAWSMWRETGALSLGRTDGTRHLPDIAVKGVLINILNPKLSIFFLAFLPQFVSSGSAHPTMEMTGLAVVFMAMTLAVFLIYAFGAAWARTYVVTRPAVMNWVRRLFAGTFAAFGARLAFAER